MLPSELRPALAPAAILLVAALAAAFGPALPESVAGMRTLGPYIVLAIGVTSLYTFQVTEQARKLSDALAATELVLTREQHLTQIDGLAAAAAHELGTPLSTIFLISRELEKALQENGAAQDPHNRSAPPARPSDPLFDRPYEPSNPEAEASWEKKPAGPAPRGISPYIKPKKKVAALFGAKKAPDEEVSSS